MLRKTTFLLVLLLIPNLGFAQLYSGLIDAQRATTAWTTAGATILTEGHTCYTLTTAVSLSTLNSDISSCSKGASARNIGLITLAAGTYNFAGAINMKSNVILRGSGMSTILNITSTSGSTWLAGGGTSSLTFVGSFPTWKDSSPPMVGTGGNQKNWTGTNGNRSVYTKGATVLNLGSAPTGLAAGDMLVCNQSDAPDEGLPNSGFFVSDKTGASNAISQFGTYYDFNGAMEQRSIVTNVRGTDVTIADGLMHPTGTWATGLTPQCGWIPSWALIQNAGVENLLVQTTGNTSAQDCVIGMWFAFNSWIKGVGILPYYKPFHSSGAVNFVVAVNDSVHATVRDSWLGRAQGGGNSTTTTYGVVLQETHFSLIENNIYDNVEAPAAILIGTAGDVYGYNFEHYVGDDRQEGGVQQHDPASAMTLVEGNKFRKLWADNLHGNSVLNTYFRNHIEGGGMDLAGYNRWFNLIGNVINSATAYKSCITDSTKYDRFSSVAFRLGYPNQNANNTTTAGVAGDAVVCTSTMLWGNYSAFGSSSHFTSGEVPTSDSVFPNALPANNNLPPSLYHSVVPPFWTPNKPWPLIGPDVTGGNVAGLGGHANTTPAEDCYTKSGGRIANFNPGTCYGRRN
jgi:hypothetical protein